MAKSKWPQVRERFAEIEAWVRAVATEKLIYTNLGLGRTSWEKYKNEHDELRELLKRSREKQVEEVEDSLYKAAVGYYYTTQEAIKVKLPDGGEEVQVVSVTKFKPPEVGAMCFFLKNKAKKDYADNPQAIDIKREELEIRRREANFRTW